MDKYQNGQLTPTASASALAYAAMGGMGAERGRGMGRGRATGVRGMGVEVLWRGRCEIKPYNARSD
ncbi:MAG: hypothetical protein KJP23_30335 [Deltaproteobacteria bacterium]|nr:hypothetical protein [Deltaproteobacteria bacterium]